MLNTSENDSPYVINNIADLTSNDFKTSNGSHVSGTGLDTINPFVVNDDGSFIFAFQVQAPAYSNYFDFPLTGNSIIFTSAGGSATQFSGLQYSEDSSDSVQFTLTGRDGLGNPVSVAIEPVNGRLVIPEAIQSNFAPGSQTVLYISGLADGSTISGVVQNEIKHFYDPAGPSSDVSAIKLGFSELALTNEVEESGFVSLTNPLGLTNSFTLVNAESWTTPDTGFVLVVASSEPLDLSGLEGPLFVENDFSNNIFYQTVFPVSAVDGVVSVPEALLQQLQELPASIYLSTGNAVPGATAQASAQTQLPVTTVTEGLYVQHFDASGNPTGEAMRVDDAANELIGSENVANFAMSRGGDGEILIAWLGNADANAAPDAVYVKKLAENGTPLSDTLPLQGVDLSAAFDVINGDAIGAIAGLADGGYAIAYSIDADDFVGNYSIFGAGNSGSISATLGPIRGQLDSLQIGGNAISDAIAATPHDGFVTGFGPDGELLSIPVTIINGRFDVTEEIRAQFAPDERIALQVTGISNPDAEPGEFGFVFISLTITSRDIFSFDESSELVSVNQTNTASSSSNPASADAFFGSGVGQTVAYEINDLTTEVDQTPEFVLLISALNPIDTAELEIYSGVQAPPFYSSTPNTFSAATNLYSTTVAVEPVDGRIEVPSAALAQFPNGGLSVGLFVRGLEGGSPASVNTIYREPANIIEPGLFLQTFDADGNSQGPAQRIDDADASLAQPAQPQEDGGAALSITPDADGSFRVSWIANNGEDDRIVSRQFDGDGNAVGTAIDVPRGDLAIPDGDNVDVSVSNHLDMVELGDGGFATLVQVEGGDVSAQFNAFMFLPPASSGTGGSVSFTPLQGQLESLFIDQGNAIGAAIAAQPRDGFLQGKGLDGQPLSVPITIVNGQFHVTEELSSLFTPDNRLVVTISGITNPDTSVNNSSFAFVPVFIQSSNIFTFGDEGEELTFNSTGLASSNPTFPANTDFFAGSGVGQTIAFEINQLTPGSSETPEYVLFITSETPIDFSELAVFAGTPSPPIFSNTPNENVSALDLFGTTITVTPVDGRIDVPQALLAQFPHGGVNVSLYVRGLEGGTPANIDTIVRLPEDILETGLFVQLFDENGVPAPELIRVDDPATSIAEGQDYAKASIQSDGNGGFIVIWAADTLGDSGIDAFVIRHYDASGNPTGDAQSVTSIPDRVYDQQNPVTLYTAGLFADPDPDDILTYSATGLPSGLSIDPETGVISGTASNGGLFQVTVTATDAGELSASTDFEIFITAASGEGNQAPSAINFANTTDTLPENSGSVKVADIVVSDDGLGTNTLSLTGADAAFFTIVGSELFFNGGDFEDLSSYDVSVLVSDPSLPDAPVVADFRLLLTDVAEDRSVALDKGGDSFIINPASLDNWTVAGGKGDDIIRTGAGRDEIQGSVGDDDIASGANDDVVNGDHGDDIIAGGAGDDDLTGGSGDDTLLGQDGEDLLYGLNGDDIISGGEGDDTIEGGSGDDLLDGDDGNDTIGGGSGDDTINGGRGSDQLLGGTGDDTIDGENGSDVIDGGSGDDLLRGGHGRDSIGGGSGDDEINGDAGNDIIIGGNGSDLLYGGRDHDVISGDRGNDTAYGGEGDDEINGGGGSDSLFGDEGDDLLLGGSGDDLLGGGAGEDTIRGDRGDDIIAGDDGDDVLYGDQGHDTINGGAGNDTIIGGAGTDLLTGGGASDTFVFESRSDSKKGSRADHITDFDALLDRIDLSQLDANIRTPGDDAFSWIGSGAFTRNAGELRFEVIDGSAHITGDMNGNGRADFEIVLDGVTSLPATDEIFVL